MISATAFLHFFSWEEQVAACNRIIQFVKPFDAADENRQVVFGRQTVSLEPGVWAGENVRWGRKELFMHDYQHSRTVGECWLQGLLARSGKLKGT